MENIIGTTIFVSVSIVLVALLVTVLAPDKPSKKKNQNG